jgi:hypothetical protein
MTVSHQQFSAKARKSGELDKPGKRRRNLETGRISVVLGADAACVIEEMARSEGRSTGGTIRKIVLEYLSSARGLSGAGLTAHAAELRAAKTQAAEKAV